MGKPLPPIMGDSKKSTPPTSTTSSATSSSSAPANGGGSGMKLPSGTTPNLLLGLSGGWLLARMLLFGGILPNGEIFVLAIITLIAVGLNRKIWVPALIIGIILLVHFLHPTLNQDVKAVRENKVNPPGEMAPIVINRDGEYDLPDRPLKVCFTLTGDPNQNFYLDNKVEIGGTLFVQRDAGCLDIPNTLRGKISISLLSGQPYSDQVKEKIGMNDVNNNYEYYKKIGFGEYPTIFAK